MNTIYGCFSDPKYSIPSLFPEVVPDVQSCLSEPGLAHTQDILKESADNSLFHAEQKLLVTHPSYMGQQHQPRTDFLFHFSSAK